MLVQKAFANLTEDLEGDYFPLAGMEENVFASGNKNLLAACQQGEGQARWKWNNQKTVLVWFIEEDQVNIIFLQKGGDVKEVFVHLARGNKAVVEFVKTEPGKELLLGPSAATSIPAPSN